MIKTIDKYLERAISNPSNIWNWYELAKRGYTLEELLEIGKNNQEAVRAGYQEGINN